MYPLNPLQSSSSSVAAVTSGVKDDLLEIRDTIGRQFLSFASFFAPPSSSSTSTTTTIATQPAAQTSSSGGIRSDLAELGSCLRSSLSIFSPIKAANELSLLASNLLQLNCIDDYEHDEDDDRYDSGRIVGIREEVIQFVQGISQLPGFWTDFPLSLDYEDFQMLPSQIEHAYYMEKLVPSLAALKARLVPDMMDNLFWMIYFILLFPCLDEKDVKLLSTPMIVEAREELLLMKQHIPSPECKNFNVSPNANVYEAETWRDPLEEKAPSAEASVSSSMMKNEESPSIIKRSEYSPSHSVRQVQSEVGVSLSDLDDDDDWVKLNEESKVDDESNDWLVDEEEWVIAE